MTNQSEAHFAAQNVNIAECFTEILLIISTIELAQFVMIQLKGHPFIIDVLNSKSVYYRSTRMHVLSFVQFKSSFYLFLWMWQVSKSIYFSIIHIQNFNNSTS